MGGCASRPKDLNSTPATLPGENSIAEPVVKDVEVETTEETKKGDESQEEPLVDLSEPTKDPKAETDDPKNAINDLVSEISVTSDVKKTVEKVEAGNETTEKIKDEQPAAIYVEEKISETVKSDAAEVEKLSYSAPAEKKNDAPLIAA